MNQEIKVSIIIPTYDRAKTICDSVRSVLEQTYNNIEVIVIDDCSTDNTKDLLLARFETYTNFTYYKLKNNSGACVARNFGIQLAKGEIVGFLDSDDVLKKNKIEKQVDFLLKNNAQLCASSFTRIFRDGKTTVVSVPSDVRENVLNNLLYCNFITTGTLIGYKYCFEKVEFDESLPRYQDWDLVLRLCQTFKICFINDSTLNKFYQPISITTSSGPHKTLTALRVIYEKNKELYKTNRKAYSQIHWLIGVNSTLTRRNVEYTSLLIGATHNGISVKRILLFVISFFHMYSLFEKLYKSVV